MWPSPKKLVYILKALRNLPGHRSSLAIGDSNSHRMNQQEIDPVNRSVAVRSVGGLCVVSAADALKQCRFVYTKVKKLTWSIGVNDYLHRNQHCMDDWDDHLKSLFKESERVFPKASISFILPFQGLPKVDARFITILGSKIKAVYPQIKRLYAPSMRDKVSSDGVHLNPEGQSVYFNFLRKNICIPGPRPRPPHTNPAMPSTPSEPRAGTMGGAQAPRSESFRVNNSDFPNLTPNQAAPPAPPVLYSQPPHYSDQHGQVLRELSSAIHMMLARRCGPPGPGPGPPHPYGGINYPNG